MRKHTPSNEAKLQTVSREDISSQAETSREKLPQATFNVHQVSDGDAYESLDKSKDLLDVPTEPKAIEAIQSGTVSCEPGAQLAQHYPWTVTVNAHAFPSHNNWPGGSLQYAMQNHLQNSQIPHVASIPSNVTPTLQVHPPVPPSQTQLNQFNQPQLKELSLAPASLGISAQHSQSFPQSQVSTYQPQQAAQQVTPSSMQSGQSIPYPMFSVPGDHRPFLVKTADGKIKVCHPADIPNLQQRASVSHPAGVPYNLQEPARNIANPPVGLRRTEDVSGLVAGLSIGASFDEAYAGNRPESSSELSVEQSKVLPKERSLRRGPNEFAEHLAPEELFFKGQSSNAHQVLNTLKTGVGLESHIFDRDKRGNMDMQQGAESGQVLKQGPSQPNNQGTASNMGAPTSEQWNSFGYGFSPENGLSQGMYQANPMGTAPSGMNGAQTGMAASYRPGTPSSFGTYSQSGNGGNAGNASNPSNQSAASSLPSPSSGMNQWMGAGANPGKGSGMNQGIGSGPNQNMGSGAKPGMSSGMSQGSVPSGGYVDGAMGYQEDPDLSGIQPPMINQPPYGTGYEPPKAEKWYESLAVHILLVAVISLLLLIPNMFFGFVLSDREQNQDYAIRSMTSAWGGEQTVGDPELVIPVEVPVEIDQHSDSYNTRRVDYKDRFIRSKTVHTEIQINSERRFKGNYEATLYTLDIQQKGVFDLEAAMNKLESDSLQNIVHNKEVSMVFSIDDSKGIDEIKKILINGESFEASPCDEYAGFEIMLPAHMVYDAPSLEFEVHYLVRGSQRINYFATAQVSEIQFSSKGANPNFTGAYLPRERDVDLDKRTFTAKYYQNNLSTGQSMVSSFLLTDSYRRDNIIAIELFEDADSYVLINRLTKYVLLFIAMTFVTVLAFEIISRRLVSLVQYVVIGVALILFYLVLLSFSEHMSFTVSYVIGALVLSCMIALYIKAMFNSKRHALCLLIMLWAMYAVLFAIVHVEAYALLVGTILLVLMLGVVMYITRHLNLERKS